MERDMSQAFCRCGCGFYGNPATDGMCSKCYKDAIQKKNRDGMVAPQTSSSTQSTNISNQISNAISNSLNESDASTMVALAAALNLPEKNLEQKIEKETFKEEVDKSKLVNLDDNVTKPAENDVIEETKVETTAEQAKTQKKKKPRCAFCNVKLPGCVDYPCRCGGTFCVKHRYDKEHNCTFDYREHGAQEIRKNNPQIVGEKIQKI